MDSAVKAQRYLMLVRDAYKLLIIRQMHAARRELAGRTSFLLIGIAGLMLAMPLLRYRSLHSGYYDLGQYTTNMTMAASNGLWGIAFRSHAHGLMLLDVPLFWLMPNPATLLVLQSLILLASGAIYTRLWQRLGNRSPQTALWLLAASLSVWSSVLFDFHFEHWLFLLYFLFFIRLERNGPFVAIELIAIAAAICLIKEGYALTATMLGAYLLAARLHTQTGTAILLGALSYFFVATMCIIPRVSDGLAVGQLWHDAFAYLGATPADMLFNAITKPWVWLARDTLAWRQLLFVSVLLAPFGLVIVRVPLLLLPVLPHLIIMMLSRVENHSYLLDQYTVPIIVPMLVSVLYALAGNTACPLPTRWTRHLPQSRISILRVAMVGSVVTFLLFSPGPLSRIFFSPSAWSFNASAYRVTRRDHAIAALIRQYVPAEHNVVVSMQNTLQQARLAVRTHALAFPDGVFTPVHVYPPAALLTHGLGSAPPPSVWRRPDAAALAQTGQVDADYVVVDLRRPHYINDRPMPGIGPWGPEIDDEFTRLVARLPATFELMVSYDAFEIWRRNAR